MVGPQRHCEQPGARDSKRHTPGPAAIAPPAPQVRARQPKSARQDDREQQIEECQEGLGQSLQYQAIVTQFRAEHAEPHHTALERGCVDTTCEPSRVGACPRG